MIPPTTTESVIGIIMGVIGVLAMLKLLELWDE